MAAEQDWRTIGVMGAGRGTGVTHLSVWMANYLTSVRRERTAVVEWNRHGDFARLGRACGSVEAAGQNRDDRDGAGCDWEARQEPEADFFRVLDAEYFPDAGPEELALCLNEDYRRIIVDYGESTGESRLECARCDRKIVVGALSEWQAGAFLDEVKRKAERDQSWSYATVFGSEEARKQLEKTFRMDCLRIPSSVDAFAVIRADMRFFERLLKCGR